MRENWLYAMSRGRPPWFYYAVVVVNVLVGLFFLTGLFMGESESIMYASVLLVDRALWGASLFVISTVNLFGLIRKNLDIIKTSSLLAAMLWVFASASLLMAGHIYVLLTVAMLHVIFHVHLFIAAIVGAVFQL